MPTKFVDNAGNELVISLSYGLIRSIRNETGIDVSNPNDIPKLLYSQADMIQFAYCALRSKLNNLDISETKFEENLEGENTFHELSEAVLAELANFTERFGQKPLAKNIRAAIKAIQEMKTAEG